MKLRMVSRFAVITLIVVVAIIAIVYQVVTTHANSQPPTHPTPTHTSGVIAPTPLQPEYFLSLSW